MKRYLIITADDFGFSAERNKGIKEAAQKGIATSASILLNCTGTKEAIQFGKSGAVCPGLHLNLTEGQPICPDIFQTLTTEGGIFRGKDGTRRALEAGEIDLNEVKKEIDSQIERYEELYGEKPVYVDGHQHIHLHTDVMQIFAKSLESHGIKVTRYPKETDMEYRTWLSDCLKVFYKDVLKNMDEAKVILDKHGIKTPDAFTGLTTMGANMTAERLQQTILEAFEAAEKRLTGTGQDRVVCELMTHTGHATGPDYGGFSWGSDDFGRSKEREHEIQVLSSKEMADFYKENNIQLTSHKTLVD